jgi:hypothetical protein
LNIKNDHRQEDVTELKPCDVTDKHYSNHIIDTEQKTESGFFAFVTRVKCFLLFFFVLIVTTRFYIICFSRVIIFDGIL